MLPKMFYDIDIFRLETVHKCMTDILKIALASMVW